ncbi:SufD family Fe-S cluster assembly protein [Sphingomonas rhizophila]|uniref:SufD family Fe-S cluster assembly protein n=1 Tax=Sphingomonas rhizophila TaxID=2071607 RepID=A0A7G9SA95_9SPHN|nr:SufD family Fe-S cluster assembly protein [Sphingomonas rhizophila]QNN64770.1 SufD family Fe-S cluster assembly protein [Sphingomonas rhizophila]
MTVLPTRRDEAFRYADIDALASVWSDLSPPQTIEIAAQQSLQQIWLPSGEDVQVRRVDLTLQAGASARIFALNAAARYGRIELDVTLHDAADFTFDAANIGGGSATLEIVTTVRHVEPSATSRQTVRSVLGGKATGSYLGKVAVSRGAEGTDSEQSVKAMLLDRGATANAKPELEIYADDVKCAHGATVGELDRNQLFYAAARGLDPASARALLLEGFVGGLWDGILGDDQGIADAARAALKAVVR